jgi:C-terminal of NADH-ubiquinone oxidoreductase 21 kDa subunit
MAQRVAEGKPLYGESQLSPYLQSVAAGNSRNAQLKFSKLPSLLHDTLLLYRVLKFFNSILYLSGAIPWFNFANHDQHGVDAAKYNETQ